MKETTFDALLARALHQSTGAPEATASMGRILASEEGRAMLRDRLSSPSAPASWRKDYDRLLRGQAELRTRYDHNRRELERAVAEVARLRRELEFTRQAADQAARAADDLAASATPSLKASPSNGQPSRSAPSPRTITLKWKARCADPDCGAELDVGTRARWWGRGRIYCLSHAEART